MFSRLVRAAGALLVVVAGVFAQPAFADVVNGIDVDSTLPQISHSGYSFQIVPTGPASYSGPYTFAHISGSLPSGISISPSGVVSGTTCGANGNWPNIGVRITKTTAPVVVSDFTFRVNVTGSQGACGLTMGAAPPNGVVGLSYSGSITASGGANPKTYTVVVGSLPPGLSMNASGAITGTPTAAGAYTFDVRASDGSDIGTATYTITVLTALTVNPASMPGGQTTVAYTTQTLTASNGTAPYTFALDSGALPTGLVLAGNTLSGTPTNAGTYTFAIRATDAIGSTGTRSYTVAIAGTDLVSLSALPNGLLATAYSNTIASSAGVAPYTYTITAGAPPPGLVLSSAGVLSGTPSVAGSYPFTVTSTDANGNFGSRAYTVVIGGANTLTIAPASLASGTRNAAYSQAITASGGTPAYTYTLDSGALPAGLTLASNGTLSGTPNATGTFNIVVRGTDSLGNYGLGTYSLAIAAPTFAFSPGSLADGTNGVAYSQSMHASGGTAPYTWSVDSGALPVGLTLASNGTLSGTPAGAGTFNFAVRATDANADSATHSYAMTIASASIAISPYSLGNATVNTPYSDTFAASGGAGGYNFSVSAGAFPVGMSLASNGVFSGTPASVGTYDFTINVTDSAGDTASQAYTFVVDAVTIAVSPSALPGGTNASAYNQSLSASGGTAPYSYSLSAGALPVGLSFSSSGTLSGTPSVAGTYNFTVTATDANANVGSQAYSIVIASATIAIAPGTLPNATTNVAYSRTLSASGGAAPYTYSLSAGALPIGVSFSSAGVLSGTPTTAGSHNFTIKATDANGDTASQAYSLNVDTVTITLPASLPNGTNATAYAQSIAASGGNGPYTYALSSGALPVGLSLASNGTLSGTPSVAGSYTFTVQATDADTNTGAQAYTVAIASALITITPATLPNCTNGTAYSHSLSATGGTGTYTFSLAAGAMPVGMSLTSAGVFAGTPGSAGTFNFTVRATDGNGDSATQAYSLAIGAASIDITPASLPGGRRGDAYAQSLTAAGGTGPYTYSIGSGALPAGLALAANGALTGTPTATGTWNVRIDAKDANGDIGQRTYAFAIAEAIALDITPGTLANGRKGVAFSATFLANGGTGPYTFAIADGALPAGMTLAANGTLSGTPTAAGTYTFTVRGNDNAGHAGERSYSWAIAVAARPDPTTLRDVRDAVNEQFGAARRLGELQMGQVFRRLDAGTMPCAKAEVDGCKTLVEVWATGTRETSYVGTTSAINAFTVGADLQLGPARIGAAFGTGDDLVEVASGYRGDTDGKTWMLYGRVGLGDVFGVAAVAGRTDLDLDSRRMNDGAGATFGHRGGTTDFVGIELNATLMRGDGGVVPYVRYEKGSTDLDAFTESGNAMALQYGRVSADNTAFVAGAEAFVTKRYNWGSLTPRFRGEYRDRSGDDVHQALWYVDAPGSPFVLDVAGIDDRGAMFSIGVEAATGGFRVSLDWGTAGSSGEWFRGQSLRLQLRADF